MTDRRALLRFSCPCAVLALQCLLLGTSGRDLLANEQADNTDGDYKDDAEDDDDTGFLLSPVLTLGDVGDRLTGDQGVVDSRHFVDCARGGPYKSIVSHGPVVRVCIGCSQMAGGSGQNQRSGKNPSHDKSKWPRSCPAKLQAKPRRRESSIGDRDGG